MCNGERLDIIQHLFEHDTTLFIQAFYWGQNLLHCRCTLMEASSGSTVAAPAQTP